MSNFFAKNFFINLKQIIKTAAVEAVFEAEKTFGSGAGAVKKQAAIAFVVNAIPAPALIKPIITAFLGKFIDRSIEIAVAKLKEK